MDTLAEIQERHEAVRDVERKLLDLQQVFNQSFQLNFHALFIHFTLFPNDYNFHVFADIYGYCSVS